MHAALPRILSVGLRPPNRYTQQDIIERFRVAKPTVRNISASHIEGRHLYLLGR